MKHLGDITKINGAEVPTVDVVIGGSPCQNFSVAGNRKGLEGEESSLFDEQPRIIKEMRKQSEASGATEIKPRYFVWENVPGAFSTHGGEDFRKALEAVVKIADENASIPRPTGGGGTQWRTSGVIMGNGFSIAWRVLDAQFWGVPQRRRRIALVADFGGYTAPEILFVRKGLSWRVTESGGERKRTSSDLKGNPRTAIGFNYLMGSKARGIGAEEDRSETLRAGSLGAAVCYENGEPVGVDTYNQTTTGDRTRTLLSRHTDADGLPCVLTPDPIAFHLTQDTIFGEKSPCLTAGNPVGGQASVGVCYSLHRAFFNAGKNAQYTPTVEKDLSPTLVAKGAGAVFAIGNGQADGTGLHKVAGALNCMHDQQAIMTAARKVRRFTPLECERLQGFPDGWTQVGEFVGYKPCKSVDDDGKTVEEWQEAVFEYTDQNGKTKRTTDGARYKAIGNSIAIPPWKWILKRLCSFYERDATMASLFDGIGGFPLIWEQLNGKGSCLWASEIDDFSIAVTKAHFAE